MSKFIHYFPSEVIEEECTKDGVVGTYLLNDVDGGTMSRECQQQWEGRWTFGGGEGGGEGCGHNWEGGAEDYDLIVNRKASSLLVSSQLHD